MKIQSLFALFLMLSLGNSANAQNSQALTYNVGDIPTSLSTYYPTCNGPSTTLTFTVPSGENIDITSIDITYDFSSYGSNSPLLQRSAIYCQNTGIAEAEVAGVGTVEGSTETYARIGLSIANGNISLYSNTTGYRNTTSGYQSVYFNTSGDENTANGYQSLYFNTIGDNRTGIGYSANSAGSNYNNNTSVGNNADCSASNQVRLGNTSITSIGGYANWTNLSDQRFKLLNPHSLTM